MPAFHERMVNVFDIVRAAVEAESAPEFGAYGCFLAFDTLIVHRHPIPAGALNWTLLNEFCYFASLIDLRLLIEHDMLIRDVVGVTTDYRLDDRVMTGAEIDRMYGLEKAQESATVLVDLKTQIEHWDRVPDPGRCTSPDADPYLFHPVVFKKQERPEHLSAPPHDPDVAPVLRLLNPRTVRYLIEQRLSFRAALARLESRLADDGLPPDVRIKLVNTAAYLRADLAHYDSQGTDLQTKIRGVFNRLDGTDRQWLPVP